MLISLVQDLDCSKIFLSLDAQTIAIIPTRPPLSSPSLVNRSLRSVLDLVTLLKSMMIKEKEFTMSHLDRFNIIDVLNVKGLVTLLSNSKQDKNFDY